MTDPTPDQPLSEPQAPKTPEEGAGGHPVEQAITELRQFIRKLFPFFQRLKNTPTVYPLYFFYFTFGITFLVAMAAFNRMGKIAWEFYIPESGEQMVFYLPVGELFGVFMLGGVFSLTALRAFELLRQQVAPSRKTYGTRLLVVIIYVSCLILLIIGIVVHMVGNQLHEYIYQIEAEQPIARDTPLSDLKAGIYLWDEIIGHLLIGIGFFGMLYINIFLALISTHDVAVRKDEMVSITIGSLLLGAGIAIGFLEGQAGFPFLWALVFMLVMVIIIRHKNKLSYSKMPFVYAGVIVAIGYIITIIIWALVLGTRSFYPFFYQPSELISY